MQANLQLEKQNESLASITVRARTAVEDIEKAGMRNFSYYL